MKSFLKRPKNYAKSLQHFCINTKQQLKIIKNLETHFHPDNLYIYNKNTQRQSKQIFFNNQVIAGLSCIVITSTQKYVVPCEYLCSTAAD